MRRRLRAKAAWLLTRRPIVAALSLSLPGLRGLGIGEVTWLSVKDFFVDDMTTYGAALSFHFFLALFPFAVFLVALLSILRIPGSFDWLIGQTSVILPAPLMGQVTQAVEQVHAQYHGGLLSAGVIGAVWAASTGTRSVMNALNVAYDVTEDRPLWRRYLLSIVFTIGFAVLVIIATALMLGGPEGVTWLAGRVGLDKEFVALWAWLRVPIALSLLTLAVALVYYVVPNDDQPFQFLTPGAALAMLVWLAASIGFSTYVTTFAHYTATYGSLAAIVVLLLYFYVSSLALLLGAEVNGVIYQHAPRHKKDHARSTFWRRYLRRWLWGRPRPRR